MKKEREAISISPLHRRPVLHRLDVYPFALGYFLLVLLEIAEPREWLAALTDAAFLLLLLGQVVLFLMCQWDPLWHAAVAYRRSDGKTGAELQTWTHCLVVPFTAALACRPARPGIVRCNVSGVDRGRSRVATIRWHGWTYRCWISALGSVDLPMECIWRQREEAEPGDLSGCEEEEEAERNGTSPGCCHQFHRLHFPIDLALKFYGRWRGHGAASLRSARQVYGLNRTDIPLPPFLSLLAQQLLQPMFLFQLFCVVLWSLDEYWMYALFTLLTLLLFEAIQAGQRYKNVSRLREEVTGAAGNSHTCYRGGEWLTLPSSELVVGDVVSLVSPSVHERRRGRAVHTRNERDQTVPADLLLLQGRAVVNEAMLTGESVPQVKEANEVDNNLHDTSVLDLSDGSAHKRCVLFAGTVMIDHFVEREGGNDAALAPTGIPAPPDGGLACFVLRTGFDTVQGSLLRNLVYEAEVGSHGGGNGVDARETYVFLLILLLCAVLSAATVVQHAWGDVTRNRFKLILHVIVIVTCVIPPELPMELSLAVTTSLGELVKRCQVYCTEPFRIPLAGLVDTCCFDKTGTLTSDELRLLGVRPPSMPPVQPQEEGSANGKHDGEDLILFDDALSRSTAFTPVRGDSGYDTAIRSLLPRSTLRVMVGCQSLAATRVLVPGRDGQTTIQTELVGDPLERAVMEGCGFTVHPTTEMVMAQGGVNGDVGGGAWIRVLHRFAFSSKLRRMTVLALDAGAVLPSHGNNSCGPTLWALTKGAPEALEPLLDPRTIPSDYEASYLHHMELGRRVLALAYRDLGKQQPQQLTKWKSSRASLERNMTYAGLLVLDSPLKADSARVVKELGGGNQHVVMVTGDSVQTAAEVARRVGIVNTNVYELHFPNGNGGGSSGNSETFAFRPLNHRVGKGAKEERVTLPKLKAMVAEGRANFCVTGNMLTKLALRAVARAASAGSSLSIPDNDGHVALDHPAARAALSDMVSLISIFARHAPHQKEAVVAAFNAAGRTTLFCGDGTNDVGALKQAHVGVSIVSVPGLEKKQRSAQDEISAAKAEERKEQRKAKKAAKKKIKEKDAPSRNKSPKASKKPKKNRIERIEQSLQALREAEDELNFVSLGNASVASPFTSRKTSIRCCTDVLQQGRCTLVTMIQIYKILGVQCLVNALVLTKLHQKGVKQGDRQLTAVGIVVSVLFLFVTRGKPIPKLSAQKPPSSVLSRETFVSMTVQFSVHFLAIMAVTLISDVYVDPYDPSIVPDGPFHPNTLNTATFLITVLATINAFLVNYRGQPFMEDLKENRLFFRSIQGCYFVLFACSSEVFPPLNQLLQLSPLPSWSPPSFGRHQENFGFVHSLLLQAVNFVGFRTMLCLIMCMDTALVCVLENFIRSTFEGSLVLSSVSDHFESN